MRTDAVETWHNMTIKYTDKLASNRANELCVGIIPVHRLNMHYIRTQLFIAKQVKESADILGRDL
jgi:hypothetical protein